MLQPLRFTVHNYNIAMLPVIGATFRMGSTKQIDPDAWGNEEPVHDVRLSSFYLAEYPVTQSLWQAVMGDTPSYFTGNQRPAEQVSWDDAKAFIKKLRAKTDREFRLPTEAEWEFAARGGVYNTGLKYAGSNRIKEVAWFDTNSHGETKPAGWKFRNELGLYDMSGNVWEWCEDWYGGSEYYEACKKQGVAVDPTGPEQGTSRVGRGGSWNFNAQFCRSANRSCWQPGYRRLNQGFRLALSLQAEE